MKKIIDELIELCEGAVNGNWTNDTVLVALKDLIAIADKPRVKPERKCKHEFQTNDGTEYKKCLSCGMYFKAPSSPKSKPELPAKIEYYNEIEDYFNQLRACVAWLMGGEK